MFSNPQSEDNRTNMLVKKKNAVFASQWIERPKIHILSHFHTTKINVTYIWDQILKLGQDLSVHYTRNGKLQLHVNVSSYKMHSSFIQYMKGYKTLQCKTPSCALGPYQNPVISDSNHLCLSKAFHSSTFSWLGGSSILVTTWNCEKYLWLTSLVLVIPT